MREDRLSNRIVAVIFQGGGFSATGSGLLDRLFDPAEELLRQPGARFIIDRTKLQVDAQR